MKPFSETITTALFGTQFMQGWEYKDGQNGWLVRITSDKSLFIYKTPKDKERAFN
jgi:hypothetical protein